MTDTVPGDYLDIEATQAQDGLRLLLSRRVPAPSGEAAKNSFHLKGLAGTRVVRLPGEANDALHASTGRRPAPVAVSNDKPPWTVSTAAMKSDAR